jgi:hypothetical protein
MEAFPAAREHPRHPAGLHLVAIKDGGLRIPILRTSECREQPWSRIGYELNEGFNCEVAWFRCLPFANFLVGNN